VPATVEQALAVRDLLRAALAAQQPPPTLLDIAQTVLPDYRPTPHTDHLAAILTSAIEDAENGKDARLVVELPPGEGKSSLCSVAAPLFALSRNPSWEIGLVSAESSLANKFSRDCRHAVKEDLIPNVSLSADKTEVTEWETTSDGSVIARGINGMITGRRIKFLALDDPIKDLADAHSRLIREKIWNTWQSVLKTRMRPGSVVILVMTRWHEDDLAGRLLATGDWTEVRCAAIAEEGDVLGRAVGEPLLSPQIDETIEEALARWAQTKSEVGPYVWDAMFQQRPQPPGGRVFQSDWWGELPRPATFDRMITSWDLTFGSETGDYAVGQVWGQTGADCWLIDMVRGRWSFPEQIEQIERLALAYPDVTAHVVEKKANGAAAIQTLTRKIPGLIPVNPHGSKEIRADAVAPFVRAGNVHLPPSAHWLIDFHSELAGFPSSAPHDDIVDALTQALDYLRVPHKGTVTANPAHQRVASASGAGMRGRSL
jgi:predicted phage terminase large subunit-like protein